MWLWHNRAALPRQRSTHPHKEEPIRVEISGEAFTFSEVDLPAAICRLREALGRSPEAMARLLGCSLAGYQKWELGRAVPSGEWLLKLLQLCPDEEVRNAFRIRSERRSRSRSSPHPDEPVPLTSEQRARYHEMARRAAEDLAASGEAGVTAADARLRWFAENMHEAAEHCRPLRKEEDR